MVGSAGAGEAPVHPRQSRERGGSRHEPPPGGGVLVALYYYSYAMANHFYGFTRQVPATVYIATTHPKRPTEVMMAEPEKAVVDSLDKMSYAGGIVEVARVAHSVRSRVDLEKLADYALRMGSRALVQRLGYLAGNPDRSPAAGACGEATGGHREVQDPSGADQ